MTEPPLDTLNAFKIAGRWIKGKAKQRAGSAWTTLGLIFFAIGQSSLIYIFQHRTFIDPKNQYLAAYSLVSVLGFLIILRQEKINGSVQDYYAGAQAEAVRKDDAIDALQQEIFLVKVQHYEDIKSYLNERLASICSNNLNFDGSHRASIYLYDREEDSFVIVARYARNETFGKIRRKEFPCNEGFIGEAWQDHDGEGIYLSEMLPTPYSSKRRKSYTNSYLDAHKDRYDVPKGTAKNFRMPTVQYWAYNLDSGEKRLGIIVCETIKPRGFIETKLITECFDSEKESILSYLRILEGLEYPLPPVGTGEE